MIVANLTNNLMPARETETEINRWQEPKKCKSNTNRVKLQLQHNKALVIRHMRNSQCSTSMTVAETGNKYWQ